MLPPLTADISRTALSMAFFSAWLLLLFVGWAFGGAVHLLLAVALWLFPWKWLRIPADLSPEEDPEAE